TSKQRFREKFFRYAMSLGHIMPANGCLLYTLCAYGCMDLVRYGVQTTNPTDRSDDPDYFHTMVEAWQLGQAYASEVHNNVNECRNVCAPTYPECSTGTSSEFTNWWNRWWLQVYEKGHFAGMVSTRQKFRDDFFHVMMAVGNVLPKACQLYTLCTAGCEDLVSYGNPENIIGLIIRVMDMPVLLVKM
ncbi:unnamed protein product, partial [Oppiella nova]